ncbi:hypothetical protein BaRGS_00035794, partial [Batillaria attramentaria]
DSKRPSGSGKPTGYGYAVRDGNLDLPDNLSKSSTCLLASSTKLDEHASNIGNRYANADNLTEGLSIAASGLQQKIINPGQAHCEQPCCGHGNQLTHVLQPSFGCRSECHHPDLLQAHLFSSDVDDASRTQFQRSSFSNSVEDQTHVLRPKYADLRREGLVVEVGDRVKRGRDWAWGNQ